MHISHNWQPCYVQPYIISRYKSLDPTPNIRLSVFHLGRNRPDAAAMAHRWKLAGKVTLSSPMTGRQAHLIGKGKLSTLVGPPVKLPSKTYMRRRPLQLNLTESSQSRHLALFVVYTLTAAFFQHLQKCNHSLNFY